MKVKEAMHKGAEWVPPTTTVVELAKMMVKHDIGAIPIGENDKLIGMVTDRDIVCRGLSNGKDISKLWPISYEGQSDTACFDNALEFLVRFYEGWDRSQPNRGYAARAAEWQQRLAASVVEPRSVR